MNNENCGFWSTDQLPYHLVNEETFRQLHNIWFYICPHFMIWTSRNMKYELLRFFSFLNYPGSSQQDIRKLALAGFYYFGDGDTVVCYCCGLWKRNWRSTDDPFATHASSCPFSRRNWQVNLPYTTTEHGGFRPTNAITILARTRRMGPTVVQPDEYIQAHTLENVQLRNEISLTDYSRYSGLLPDAALFTTQSAQLNNENAHQTYCVWSTELYTNCSRQLNEFRRSIPPLQYDHSFRNISSLVYQPDKSMKTAGAEIDEKPSNEKRPCVDEAAHVKCLEMKQVKALCHPENFQDVEELERKNTYNDESTRSLTNVKIYKDYDKRVGLQESNFPRNEVAEMEHSTGNLSVKASLKSDERNSNLYVFTDSSDSRENRQNSKTEQTKVNAACQNQLQTKAVNARNVRGLETEYSNCIDDQFSARYNLADTDNNVHARQPTYTVSTKERSFPKGTPTDINNASMYFSTTEDCFDKTDKKDQSILDRSIQDYGRKVGNTQVNAGYCGGKSKMVTKDKRISAKCKQSANMTGKTITNPKNTSSKENRVRAFRNNSVCISNQLANGGFTHTGDAGFVQCTTCGIEFKASDLQQDMWIKHANASKKCEFVLQRKGHDFVKAVHEGQDEILQRYRDLFAALEKN